MYFTPDSGVWTIKGEPSWKGQYYLFEVEVFAPSTGKIETNLVTDPYSLSLATNSKRSQIVNLADAALAPGRLGHAGEAGAGRARRHHGLRAPRARLQRQ